MPSESLLGIAGDISASTCTELYSGKWVHTTYSGCGDNRIGKEQGSTVDRAGALELVKQDGRKLAKLDDGLKSDREIVLAAVNSR